MKIPGITKEIRKILSKYPHASPMEIARFLYEKIGKNLFPDERSFYLYYRGLINTEKWAWNKWLKTEEKGRLLKSLKISTKARLLDSHRIEWTFETPLSQVYIEKISMEASKIRPGSKDKKPIGSWYVIPNRNRMREFHNEHLTVRIFPISGTARILPAYVMPFEHLRIYLENALFLGGLSIEESEKLSWEIIPSSRSKTFHVGRVDPFKIDYYEKSLGMVIKADGSHPRHIEVDEKFPAWTKILIQSNIDLSNTQKELSENMRSHIEVLKSINESFQEFLKVLKKWRQKE